jgi:hypothetical protein
MEAGSGRCPSRADIPQPEGENYPVLEGRVVSPDEVKKAVDDTGGAVVRNAIVQEPFSLDLSAVEYLMVERTIFTDEVELTADSPGASVETENEILFYDSRFESSVGVGGLFSPVESIQFECAVFEDVANFSYSEFSSLILFQCEFLDRAQFVDSFYASLNIWEVDFKGRTDFSGSQFEDINLVRLSSDDPIIIRWSQFGRRLLYGPDEAPDGDKGCVKKHVRRVWNTLPLPDIVPPEDDYVGTVSWAQFGDANSRYLQVEADLLFWKENFTSLGLERDVREVEREIITLRRDYMVGCFSPEWLMTWVLGPPSDFGASPFRPLFISFLVIPAFAVYYWAVGALRQQRSATSRVKMPAGIPRPPVPTRRRTHAASPPAQRASIWTALFWSADSFTSVTLTMGTKVSALQNRAVQILAR